MSDSEETLIKVTDCGPNIKQNGRERRRIEKYNVHVERRETQK